MLTTINQHKYHLHLCTVEPLLRGHPDERPTSLERPLDSINLNINVLISTPDERPPLLKGHFPDAKGMASQEGFYCMFNYSQSYCQFFFYKFPTNIFHST